MTYYSTKMPIFAFHCHRQGLHLSISCVVAGAGLRHLLQRLIFSFFIVLPLDMMNRSNDD